MRLLGIVQRQQVLFDSGVVDAQARDRVSQTKQDADWRGWGMPKVLWNYETLVKTVMTIAGALALFTRQVPQSGGALTALNHPLIIVFIIGAMLAIAAAALVFSGQGRRLFDEAFRRCEDGKQDFFAYALLDTIAGAHWTSEHAGRTGCAKRRSRLPENPARALAGKRRLPAGTIGVLNVLSGAVSQVFTGVVHLFMCLKAWDGAVFHEGRLIQRSSHDALVADAHSKYHELWYAQAQYYTQTQMTDAG